MRSGTGAAVRWAALLLVVLTSLVGCGFLDELADPPETPQPPASAPLTPVEPPAGPVVVASVSLSDDRDLPGAPLRAEVEVAGHPVAPGLPPLGGQFGADCGFASDTTRYVAVDLTFTNRARSVVNVAADESLVGTPPGVVGLFTESGAPGVRYCEDGDRAPTVDRLVLGGGVGAVQTVSVFLVTDDPGTADPAGGATLALTGLRNTAMGTADLGVWTVEGGADVPPTDEISAPLG